MGEVKAHSPVKLVVGMIASSQHLFEEAETKLMLRFGNIDYHSQIMPFDFTDYYEKEMGANLIRKFVSFHELIMPDSLPDIKLFTNELEKEFAIGGSRTINIDPGYITLAKLVLASTKDYIHRIYIGKGIYAEVTLQVKNKSFSPWDWTYPDYKTKEYIEIFNQIRSIYVNQLRTKIDLSKCEGET